MLLRIPAVRRLLLATSLVAAATGCGNATGLERVPPRRIAVQQPTAVATANWLAMGGSSNQKLAQTLTVTTSGTLSEVDLPLVGGATVQIQSVGADGKPDGGVLDSDDVGAPATPPSDGFVRVPLSHPVGVTAGEPIGIVILGEGAMIDGPVGDPYAGGHGWFDALPNPPGWASISIGTGIDDLPFRAWIDVP